MLKAVPALGRGVAEVAETYAGICGKVAVVAASERGESGFVARGNHKCVRRVSCPCQAGASRRFFEYHMRIGAAESEGTHSGNAVPAKPWSVLCNQREQSSPDIER